MRSQINEEKDSITEVVSTTSYLAGVSPNSSALVALTVVADLHDVMAVLRTAALLSRSFQIRFSIDIPGLNDLLVDTPGDLGQTSVETTLERVQAHLRGLISTNTQSFILQAEMTTASFLAIGDIRVRVHQGLKGA
jgi:hypothetical protein